MPGIARQALFISHANPEDNAFTLWLGAKLTALGYEVFADILRLRGGQDWERILEDAIRNKAAKVLLVATPHGVQKQGVRNEVTIAVETAKKIKDSAFIVPLRLAPYESPLLIAHAQYSVHRFRERVVRRPFRASITGRRDRDTSTARYRKFGVVARCPVERRPHYNAGTRALGIKLARYRRNASKYQIL